MLGCDKARGSTLLKRAFSLCLSVVMLSGVFAGFQPMKAEAAAVYSNINSGVVLSQARFLGSVEETTEISIDWGAGTPESQLGDWDWVTGYMHGSNMGTVHDWYGGIGGEASGLRNNAKSNTAPPGNLYYGGVNDIESVGYMTLGDIELNEWHTQDTVIDFARDPLVYFRTGYTSGTVQEEVGGSFSVSFDSKGTIEFDMACRGCNCMPSSFTVELLNGAGGVVSGSARTISSSIKFQGRRNHDWKPNMKPSQWSAPMGSQNYIYNKVYILYTDTGYAHVALGDLPTGTYRLRVKYNCASHGSKDGCIKIVQGLNNITKWKEGVTPFCCIANLKTTDCVVDRNNESGSSVVKLLEREGAYNDYSDVRSMITFSMSGPRAAASLKSSVKPYLMKTYGREVSVHRYDNLPDERLQIPGYQSFASRVSQATSGSSPAYYPYAGFTIDLVRPCGVRTLGAPVTYTVGPIDRMGASVDRSYQWTRVFEVLDNGALRELQTTMERSQITFTSDRTTFVFATNGNIKDRIEFPLTAVGNNVDETSHLDWSAYRHDATGGNDLFMMYDKQTGTSQVFEPVEMLNSGSVDLDGSDYITSQQFGSNWRPYGDSRALSGWSYSSDANGYVVAHQSANEEWSGWFNMEDNMLGATELGFQYDFTNASLKGNGDPDDDDDVGMMVKASVTTINGKNYISGYYICVSGSPTCSNYKGRGFNIYRLKNVPESSFDSWIKSNDKTHDYGYVFSESHALLRKTFDDCNGNELWDTTPGVYTTLRVTISEDNEIVVSLGRGGESNLVEIYRVKDTDTSIDAGTIAFSTRSQRIDIRNIKILAKTLLTSKSCDVLAPEFEAPDKPIHVSTDENGVVTAKSLKDNGTPYDYVGDSFSRSNRSEVLATSNTASVTITTGIKGYWYYLSDNATESTATVKTRGSFVEGLEFQYDVKNAGGKHYLHIACMDKAKNKNTSEVLSIPITYVTARCIDICNYCGANHVLGSGNSIHRDTINPNPYIKLSVGETLDAGKVWGSDKQPNSYYLGYKLDHWTSGYCGPNGVVTLYRYFQPNKYRVDIHENTPSIATYDVVSTIGTKIDEPDDRPKDTAKIDQMYFLFGHTGIKSQGDYLTLSGWSPLNGGFSGGYNTYPKVGDRTPKYTATSDFNPATGFGGLQWTYEDIDFLPNDQKNKAVINLWAIWTPNPYKITYDKRLNQGYVSQGGDSSGNRTEIPGYTEKYTVANNNGNSASSKFTEYDPKVSGAKAVTSIVTNKDVVMDYPYKNYKKAPDELGDTIGLYVPRAYWSVTALSHYKTAIMDDFVTQTGTLRSYNGSESVGTTDLPNVKTNRNHKIESTFLEWSRLQAPSINSGFKETLTQVYPAGSTDRLVRGGTKNIIPSNHTVYASWENNSVILGVPQRRYTVTFQTGGGTIDTSGSRSGGVTKVNDTTYTKVVEWKFVGWGNEACKLKSCSHVGEHFPDDNTDRCPERCEHTGIVSNGVDYWTPTSNMTVYAHWSGGKTTVPEPKRTGYDFIGWFTKPQTDDPPKDGDETFKDNGLKYGGGDTWNYGDNSLHTVDGDLTLYAWWNRKPVFVDVYDGLFFEGQTVTYKEMLELVSIYDYEDDYVAIATKKIDEFFQPYIDRIDQDIATEKDKLEYMLENEDIFMHPGDGDEDPDEDGDREKYAEDLKKLEEGIDKLLEEKDGVIASRDDSIAEVQAHKTELQPTIASIEYVTESDNVDHHSETLSNTLIEPEIDLTPEEISLLPVEEQKAYLIPLVSESDRDHYDEWTLNTRTANIGKFWITFQVHDKGIWYNDPTDSNKRVQIPFSDTTLEYRRQCQINFNYNPEVLKQDLILAIDDSVSQLDEYILRQMAVADLEDVQNYDPWWSNKGNPTLASSYRKHMTQVSEGYTIWDKPMWWSTDAKKNLAKSVNVWAGTPKSGTELGYGSDHRWTQGKLQNTLVISAVKDFTYDPAFESEKDDMKSLLSDRHLMTLADRKAAIEKFEAEFVRNETWTKDHGVENYQEILNDILALRDNPSEQFVGSVTNMDIFLALTGFELTFDAYDQWGKYASGRLTPAAANKMYPGEDPGNPDDPVDPDDPESPYKGDPVEKTPPGYDPEFNGGYEPPETPDDPDNPGTPKPGEPDGPYDPTIIQEPPERSIRVILVAKDTDLDVATVRYREKVRFISNSQEGKYIQELSDSFWHTTLGLTSLNTAFANNGSDTSDATYQGVVVSDYSGDETSKKKVNIIVRDFDK